MYNQGWFKGVYSYEFILQRYKDTIQYLNSVLSENWIYDSGEELTKLTDDELDIFIGLLGIETLEGLHILHNLKNSLYNDVEGHVCEYGVAQGATSVLLANTIKGTNKHLYLFDSFEGLPRPSKDDLLINDIFNLGNMSKYEGTMKCGSNQVINRLQMYGLTNNITIVPGFIEHTINKTPDKVSFALVDFDFYEPIKLTLEHLHDKLPKHGVIFVDDYKFFSSGVEKAVHEFLEKHSNYTFKPSEKHEGNFCVMTKDE